MVDRGGGRGAGLEARGKGVGLLVVIGAQFPWSSGGLCPDDLFCSLSGGLHRQDDASGHGLYHRNWHAVAALLPYSGFGDRDREGVREPLQPETLPAREPSCPVDWKIVIAGTRPQRARVRQRAHIAGFVFMANPGCGWQGLPLEPLFYTGSHRLAGEVPYWTDCCPLSPRDVSKLLRGNLPLGILRLWQESSNTTGL